ncbi:MAG: CotH kinase family protein, partial [Muribaculaceae bacterium]
MKINLSIIIVLACLYGANHIVSAKTVQALQPEHTYDNESEIDSYSTRSDEATENEEQNWPASMASGTLPIMYINTENGAPVVDKVTPIPADLWIDIPEKCDSKEYALGSENEPLKLTIRGRGNSTWLLDKKPYKLKFEAKTALCGMPKHKHYALLTANSVHILGMELARQVGLGWSPNIYPVELVLNGEYLGAYDLIESIKIDKNRLDIFEQDDLEEDPDIIPYGWLVEVDNYDDEYQVKIQEPGCTPIKVTHHSPEELSEQQRQWLINSFTEINNVINSSNSEEREHWVDYIDAVSMARYFIVREILQDYDGFNGSMYMYRDNEGDSTFWKMGPMWDTAFNAWSEPTDWTMFDLPSWSVWKFLPEIFYTQNFIDA